MRSQANGMGRRIQPRNHDIPVLKGLDAWKAAVPEAIGRAEGEPAGWLSAVRPKRMTR